MSSFEGSHFTRSGDHGAPAASLPPIWVGGNTAAARESAPSTATAGARSPRRTMLARVTATTPWTAMTDSPWDRRPAPRCDAAGRDFSAIDIVFNGLRGAPGTADDDVPMPTCRAGSLPAWRHGGAATVPGDSLQHALECHRGVRQVGIRHRTLAFPGQAATTDVAQAMKVVLVSRYSMMPARPFSEPSPDCLIPPKGAWGCSVHVLTPTLPARRAALTRTARLTSLV